MVPDAAVGAIGIPEKLGLANIVAFDSLVTFPNPRLDAVTPLIADATNCVVAS